MSNHILDTISQNELTQIIKSERSVANILTKLNLGDNGQNRKRLKCSIETYCIDTSHFYKIGEKNRKHPILEKICTVCSKKFTTVHVKSKKDKVTCSVSCSNTYYRSGSDNPNWKADAYRSTCFLYHKKECVICKESNIVAVHHLDHNETNNDPINLIPLCPTHHQYWHSRFRSLVEPQIKEYINNFILTTTQKDSIL